MLERIRDMWPFSWNSSPPTSDLASSRSIFLGNTTVSLQHNPWHRVTVPAAIRPLLGTNSFLSENTILHSWNYLMILWAYAASAIGFGLTSILTLPDPETLARINEERDEFYDQQLNDDSFYDNPDTDEPLNDEVRDNQEPFNDDLEEIPQGNQPLRRSKKHHKKPPKGYWVKVPSESQVRYPDSKIKTRNNEPIDRQISYGESEEKIAEPPVEEVKEQEEIDEPYVYPGPNKYGNYPPNLNHKKDTWALKMYTNFMKFYNHNRVKLNSKKPQRNTGQSQTKGKDESKRKPYRNVRQPYPVIRQPPVLSYRPRFRPHASYRPVMYRPMSYISQQPMPAPQQSSFFKTFSGEPMSSYHKQPDETTADTWKAVTQDSTNTNRHPIRSSSQAYQQAPQPHFHTGFLRMPQPHSLLHQKSPTDQSNYRLETAEPQNTGRQSEESIPIGFQEPESYSLLQGPIKRPSDSGLFFTSEEGIPIKNEKVNNYVFKEASKKREGPDTIQSSDDDIPIGFQEPEKHSLYADNNGSDRARLKLQNKNVETSTSRIVTLQYTPEKVALIKETLENPAIHHQTAQQGQTVGKPLNNLYQKLFENSFQRHAPETSSDLHDESSNLRIEPAKLLSSSRQTVNPPQHVVKSTEVKTQKTVLKLQPVYSQQQTEEEVVSPVRRDGNVQVSDTVSSNNNSKENAEHKIPNIKLPANARLTESAEKIYNNWLNIFSQRGPST